MKLPFQKTYKGTCSGGILKWTCACLTAENHKAYCFNPFQPIDGWDYPRGTGYLTDENGIMHGHVNDFWKSNNELNGNFIEFIETKR